MKTRALIDNGAHGVLIYPELVEELGLKKHCLHTPEIVDVTLHNGQNSRSKLLDSLKLSLTSLDAAWTLKSVTALIAPRLCMPVILRLPFLIHDSIVTDHASCTCVDTVLPPPPRKPCLKEQIAETKADKKLMMAELMLVCNNHFKDHKMHPEITGDFNVVGMIHQQIEILAAEETLLKHDAQLRTEYKEVFKPIPHVCELPSDVLASRQLKNAEKMIKSHSYPSPHKYKEACGILIQQHLDAGCICPSVFPCTSPVFIAPEANPNVLPCWVNDYCQLNENTVTDSHPIPCINDILTDCAKGKIWGMIDMTNSFFQMRMNPEHIHLMAINTPLGLYEWLVMSM